MVELQAQRQAPLIQPGEGGGLGLFGSSPHHLCVAPHTGAGPGGGRKGGCS